jgi:2-iminobutanoate/2-iminopropanoate deaminase
MLKVINKAPNAPLPVGVYSQAVCVNGLVFCAGQIGLHPTTGKLVSEDILGQTKQVLSNIEAVLLASDSSVKQIVMTSVFLSEMKNAPVVNELYGQFVNIDSPPARQTVAVKELPLGALVEISVIALSNKL